MNLSPLRYGTAAVVLALTAACGGGSSPANQQTGSPASGSGEVTLDGSSTVFPISEAVAEEFQKANQGTRVTVGISGTGGGFQKFCRGETDISDASRPISKTELSACASAGDRISSSCPIAYDGIAIVVNPESRVDQRHHR